MEEILGTQKQLKEDVAGIILMEDEQNITFQTFCNRIFSSENSIFNPRFLQPHHVRIISIPLSILLRMKGIL